MSENVPPLCVRGVVKRYGRRRVLGGVDLDVAPGEVVVLVGPNGIGKSTLLGCVCGTVIPDAGTVSIGGHALTDAPLPARAALRYLPQEVEVPPGLTGHELLAFHADVFGDPTGAAEAARFCGLDEALDRFATTYSVGMRRQLAFAALTTGTAPLIVLDEPFAGVDAGGRGRMVEFLQRRLQAKAGVLLAAHDQDATELDALGARRLDLREVGGGSDASEAAGEAEASR